VGVRCVAFPDAPNGEGEPSSSSSDKPGRVRTLVAGALFPSVSIRDGTMRAMNRLMNSAPSTSAKNGAHRHCTIAAVHAGRARIVRPAGMIPTGSGES
jgi:hypothetical protein